MKGTIARLTDRGFGFITPETGEKDVFFHVNSLEGIAFDDLKEGEVVTFTVEDGPKGPAAANVTRGDDSEAPSEAPAEEETPAEETAPDAE